MPLTDFFIASPDELSRICIGWPAPLETPRIETRTNPFTKKAIHVKDWTPPDADFSRATLTPDFSRLKSVDTKGIGYAEVTVLISAVLGVDMARARDDLGRPPLVAPPECEIVLCAVVPELTQFLAAADEKQLDAFAAKWTELERADIASIPNEATRKPLLAERTAPFWREALAPIATLARSGASEGKGLYFWMSP